MTVELGALERHLAELLAVASFRDYCPNGVQVAGDRSIQRLAVGVSANLRTIEAAREWEADALLVHHGLFWDKQPVALRGSMKARVVRLLDSGMSLLAYHLPLDSHPELGNSARIARSLEIEKPWEPFGAIPGGQIGWIGPGHHPRPTKVLLQWAEDLMGPPARVYPFGPPVVKRIAVASGGCPYQLQEAIQRGADFFLTGEDTEFVQETAREEGVHVVVQGHYRSETLGVKALAEHLAERFELKWTFVDVPNEA